MYDRENELRMIAQAEADYQLEVIDWSTIAETNEELTEDEVSYVYALVTRSIPRLPDLKLEDYTS